MPFASGTEKTDQPNEETDTCRTDEGLPVGRIAEHQQIHRQGHEKTEKNQQKTQYLNNRQNTNKRYHWKCRTIPVSGGYRVVIKPPGRIMHVSPGKLRGNLVYCEMISPDRRQNPFKKPGIQP